MSTKNYKYMIMRPIELIIYYPALLIIYNVSQLVKTLGTVINNSK